jgi:hypothetical protein
MSRRRQERKHRIKVLLQVEELPKAGSALYFEIYASKERIGRVEIGRGSFTWYGKNRENGRRISWGKFAELLNGHCYD